MIYYNEITVKASNDTASVFGVSSIGLLIAVAVIILGGTAVGIIIAKKKKANKVE